MEKIIERRKACGYCNGTGKHTCYRTIGKILFIFPKEESYEDDCNVCKGTGDLLSERIIINTK